MFTDRAVYRPGQTIYFKGIVVEELDGEVKLLKDHSSEVQFINASRKIITTTNFITNSEGSFSGEFIIPTGGLNGRMTIKNKTGNASFLVENYKLPTFEVTFDSIEGQPKLNEQVTVTGIVMNYAGNAVDGASVHYRVTRKTVFPRPYYRNYLSYPIHLEREIEIANGDLVTSSTGTFELQFEGIPDNRIPLKADPVFIFEVSAVVTDITNEVQSATTRVKIGQKAAILTFDLPEIIDVNNNESHDIVATNLNGSLITIDASVSLYKLIPPTRLLSSRQWSMPDLYIIPEDEFRKDFPNAIYKDEDDRNTWKREKLIDQQFTVNRKNKIACKLL